MSDSAVIAYFSVDDPVDPWRPLCLAATPPLELQNWPDEIEDPERIEAAFVWMAPPEIWKTLRNLRLVQTIGTGVDHLLAHPPPASIPLARTVDPTLTEQMVEYALLAILTCHRGLHGHLQNQRVPLWGQPRYADTSETRVGVMGVGQIGGAILARLQAFRFRLRAWSRSAHADLPNVSHFHGPSGLSPFLAGTDILLSVLPATRATDDLLNAKRLQQLPRGAQVINLGRGSTLVESDLAGCLASGHIASCFLDVFREEPLPTTSPLWNDPKVVITPHAAGVNFATPHAAQLLADNLVRVRAGLAPLHSVAPARGY